MRRDQGFSLVELLVSTSLAACVAAAIVAASRPTDGVFQIVSEEADMQQRLRVAAAVLMTDLAMAGAGPASGPGGGPLANVVPPILPYRQASAGGDPPGSFKPDVITLMHVASSGHATIAGAIPSRSGPARVNTSVGCPLVDDACGLSRARTVLVHDRHGTFDRFRVDGADGSLLDLHHTLGDSGRIHPAGSRMVEVSVRSYFLRIDPATGAPQLARDDGDGRGASPVVDHVVGLAFEYSGDARPPATMPVPGLDEQPSTYPPGENCLVARDALMSPVARLPPLAAAEPGGLVDLPAASLTDGPWCPDSTAPNRFDADLFRIRRVAVTVRVEAGAAALRGARGAFFVRPGTSTGGRRFLPDRTLRFQVSPRNMALAAVGPLP